MSFDLKRYMQWVGVWTGRGEAQTGDETYIRMEFSTAMEGNCLLSHFEAFDASGQQLIHGVRVIYAIEPNGELRTIAYSTIHGVMILQRTPDDEGVIALSGQAANGNEILVTMVEESEDQMLFTAGWRPPGAVETDDIPRMSATLRRVKPWKPPIPKA